MVSLKGIVTILEVMLTAIILILAFLHFFPQYSVKTEWDSVLLGVKVKDILNTIDRMNKTHDFATSTSEFDEFIESIFQPDSGLIETPMIWWKEVKGPAVLGFSVEDEPYFTEGHKESMIDVFNISNTYYNYTFTLGLGYPY